MLLFIFLVSYYLHVHLHLWSEIIFKIVLVCVKYLCISWFLICIFPLGSILISYCKPYCKLLWSPPQGELILCLSLQIYFCNVYSFTILWFLLLCTWNYCSIGWSTFLILVQLVNFSLVWFLDRAGKFLWKISSLPSNRSYLYFV